MTLKKTLIAASALIALSGCTTPLTRMALPDDAVRTERQAAQLAPAAGEWSEQAIKQEGRPSVVLMTPMSLPDSVQKRKLSLELEPGATVSDVVAVLGRLGHSIILADDEAGKKSFYVPRYDGTLGGFLSALSRVTDVWFTWHEGAVVVSSKEKVSVSIPQESGFAESLATGLKALGVDDHAVSWEAGMVTLPLAPSQLKKVQTYLERMSNNAAVVTLQIAVVNVSLDQTAKQGVDWEGLSLAVGRGSQSFHGSLFQKESTPTSVVSSGQGIDAGAGTGTGTGTATPTTAVAEIASASGMLLGGGVLKGLVTGNNFSFNAMYDFLQKYGVTETRQNAKLATATGKEVVLKSLTQIPYVAEITNSATTNTTNTTNTGSARTEKADDGIEVKMTPSFDAASQVVTINLSLALKSVIAFNELKAGNQVGTFTQPTTSERSFSDVVRVRPGSTVVIGGLTYDQVSDNRGLPVFLQKGSQLESQSLKVTRQTMFVVIRPTVEVLGAVKVKSEGDELLPKGVVPQAEPPASAKKKPAATSKQSTKPAKPVELKASVSPTPLLSATSPAASVASQVKVAEPKPAVAVPVANAASAPVSTPGSPLTVPSPVAKPIATSAPVLPPLLQAKPAKLRDPSPVGADYTPLKD